MKSTHASGVVEKLEAQKARFQVRLDVISRDIANLDDAIHETVEDAVHETHPNAGKIMYPFDGWKCKSKKNQFVLCVYDEGADPALDDCLYCHQPYERK